MSFDTNKISFGSETIAEQLRKARQSTGLSLADVSKQISVRQEYLKALETGDYDKLPVGVYGKKFLREYCEFLGLSYREILEIYENEKSLRLNDKQSVFSNQIVKKIDLLVLPKILRNLFVVLALFIFLAYFGFYIKKIIAAPELSVSSPIENLITDESSINVIGITNPEVKVFINSEEILNNSNGSFSKEINLKKGINTISIEARKKFGRSNIITRQIMVKEK